MSVNNELLGRFLKKIDRSGTCWEWQGCKTPDGYGRINIGGRVALAHRFMWEQTNGKIPTSLCVRHACDNPSCVNPKHLLVGTHADNMKDMSDRGRHVSPKGEANGSSKLTEQQVVEIRRRHKPYSRKNGGSSLGREFGVSDALIGLIAKGKAWKHVA